MTGPRQALLVQLLWFLGGALLTGAVLTLVVVLLRQSFTPEQAAVFADYFNTHGGIIVLGSAALVLGSGWLAVIFYQRYPAALRRLSGQIEMMVRSDQYRSLENPGGGNFGELIKAIDGMSERFQTLQTQTESQVQSATESLAQERNRLAALMSELEQAVIVCNLEGRILLYNQRARQLFSSGTRSLVGLGRSVFSAVPNEIVVHALLRMREATALKSDEKDNAPRPVVTMVPSTHERLLRIHFAPVMTASGGEMGGMVLLLENVTESVRHNQRRHELLHQLTETSRSAVASIRAAVESLLHFPDMDEAQQRRFLEVIGQESRDLSDKLNASLRDYADSLHTHWPLEELRAEDLLIVIARNLDRTGLPVSCDEVDSDLWLTVDSYALSMTVQAICRQLYAEGDVPTIRLCAEQVGEYVHLDLVWPEVVGFSLEPGELEQLTVDQVVATQQGTTVRDVLDRHGAELWPINRASGDGVGVRLLLRAVLAPAEMQGRAHRIGDAVESRPEFYDFNLFESIGQHADLEQRSLDSLTFTVFDTETTGLDTNNDEIISIGALRIVNGRVLHSEMFEQLVNPQRNISQESEKIHGISNEMVQGKPLIKEVLPEFHDFCEDTVLAAHNAAFDMRMLQQAQSRAGVNFDGMPVIDTLLLSAVVYPEPGQHGLEKIAERFGITVVGRHTALGDAIVTAQVLVQLIRLLKEQGIVTMGEALRAAQETYLARIKY